MARTQFSITKRPPKASIQYRIVQDEVRIGLQRVGEAHVKSRERVVENWQNKPQFEYKVGIGQKQLFVRVTVKGTDKAIKLWNMIDKTGTKPHVIRPKKPGGVLRFAWGGYGSYMAKTGASPARYGGSGRVNNGKVVFRKVVNHPGFKPRKFSEKINKGLENETERQIRNAVRRGLKRAKR